MTSHASNARRPAALRGLLWRAGALSLLWLALNGLDGRSWIIGAPVALLAAWVSLRLRPAVPARWSPWGALQFAAWFLVESFRGGLDVARRALGPRLSLSPALHSYRPTLPAGGARWFFCGAISLLPGTSVVAVFGDHLLVHVLQDGPEADAELRALERRVARLFAVPQQDGAGVRR